MSPKKEDVCALVTHHQEDAPDPLHDLTSELADAIEALPDGFALFDKDDRLLFCNSRCRELYPESSAAMVPGAPFESILRHGLEHGEYAAAVGREEEWLSQRLSEHNSPDKYLEQELSDGRWVRIWEQRVPSGGLVGIRTDITDQIRSRERAERTESRLINAMDVLPIAFWLFDAEDRLVAINQRYRNRFNRHGVDPQIGQTYEELVRNCLAAGCYPQAEGREEEFVQEHLEKHREGTQEFEYQLSDGAWIKSYDYRTAEGGQVGFRVDITELKTQQLELAKAAITDDLTGLRNRRGLTELLEELREQLSPDERLAVLHIDLDKFKSINDTLGHESGDHVLRAVAKRLLEEPTTFDVVARVGGDEFLLALKTSEDDEAVYGIGKSLIFTIEEPIPCGDRLCFTGASVGVAFATPDDPDSVKHAITNADIALNASKAAGRATCSICTAEMRAKAVRIANTVNEIRMSLTRDEFVPYFQPQIDAHTREIVGFEALARWNHPTRGVMAAGEFLEAAQDTRLIEEIDMQIFSKVCDAITRLMAFGITQPKVSVNVSTVQLSNRKMVDRLIGIVEKRHIHPKWVGIEILESTLLDERSANVIENIHKLDRAGFRIELDDFGTGHAAIANLRKFPVERIKIDRSLISGIDQDSDLQLITGAIIGLARKLGIKVLCEGVETQAELDYVQSVKCSCVQGYLVGRPMCFDDLLLWIGTSQHGFAAQSPEGIVA